MTGKDTNTPQGDINVFVTHSEKMIGNKRYLVERHFTGKQDFRQAIYSAVENEAKR